MLQIELFTCILAAVMVCCVICVIFRTEDLRKNPLCVTPYGTGKSSNHMKGDFVAKNRRMMKAAMKRPYCNKKTSVPVSAIGAKQISGHLVRGIPTETQLFNPEKAG